MLKVDDEVIVKSPFWHEGKDIGNRLGRITSVASYILVHLYDYESNPVKCFRSEVRKVNKPLASDDDNRYPDEEDDFFTNLFSS